MELLNRLKARTGETNEAILIDCIESARAVIMARRFPYQEWPEKVEQQYVDLQYRIALDLFNKEGAEGELSHSENGISRGYESSWVSEQLLREIVPVCGVVR